MYAAQEGHTECALLLLQRGADVGSPTMLTAAYYVIACGHLEVLRLLASTADPVTLILCSSPFPSFRSQIQAVFRLR